MVLVALVIALIEGDMLFVVCQLRRDDIGCKDLLLLDSSIVSEKSAGPLLVRLVSLYSFFFFEKCRDHLNKQQQSVAESLCSSGSAMLNKTLN